MRALFLVLVSALAGLWGWYALDVAPQDRGRPVAVEATGEGPSAASLNNEGVRLLRRGRTADALLHFERAHEFRPLDATIAANLGRARARHAREAWRAALVPVSAAAGALLALAILWHLGRRAGDRVRLARLRLRGDPWLRVRPGDEQAELRLRFSEPLGSLVRRHPLTIVWSCAALGKHMKSRPPARAEGQDCVVRLDGERLERLRRHPGDWRAFLYLGRTEVGRAAARVG
jgi:hypothetical protein